MNPHLQRAQVLLQQHRPELAEESLRRALGEEPDLAPAHSLLALCLAAQKKYAEAETAAGQAVGLAPDNPFAHYARASVLEDRNKLPEAEAAIRQAVALDPADADYHAVLAGVLLQREEKEEALAAAETALRFDPAHIAANNLRVMALTKLGRAGEAGESIAEALAQNPDNPLSHANRAWTLLHQGRHQEALPHFREALRLDPSHEWARAGCVEALKAANPFYAVMLRYFLWMGRLPAKARWALILGLWLGSRLLGGLRHTHPGLAPWITPVLVLYVAFVLSTWLATPLFNLMLRLSQFGRHLLSDDQRRQANAVGLALAIALGWVAAWVATGLGAMPLLLAAAVCAAMMLPLSGVFSCPEGWPRTVMTVVACGLGVLALATCGLAVLATVTDSDGTASAVFASSGLHVLGVALSTWLISFLSSRTVMK